MPSLDRQYIYNYPYKKIQKKNEGIEMKHLKKSFAVILLGLVLVLAACGSKDDSNVVKVGTSTSESTTWNLVKELAAKEGIEIEIM